MWTLTQGHELILKTPTVFETNEMEYKFSTHNTNMNMKVITVQACVPEFGSVCVKCELIPECPSPTLCGCERSVGQRHVERTDEQGHVLVARTVGRPLTARHVDVVMQPLDTLHHRLSHCLQTGLLGQLCCYHGNDFLQWQTAEETASQRTALLMLEMLKK